VKNEPGLRPWGLVIAAVHGPVVSPEAVDAFRAALVQGAGRVRYRHRAAEPPWLDEMDAAMGAPLVDGHLVEGKASAARFSAWAVPIAAATPVGDE
jgi:hypothetical protein